MLGNFAIVYLESQECTKAIEASLRRLQYSQWIALSRDLDSQPFLAENDKYQILKLFELVACLFHGELLSQFQQGFWVNHGVKHAAAKYLCDRYKETVDNSWPLFMKTHGHAGEHLVEAILSPFHPYE